MFNIPLTVTVNSATDSCVALHFLQNMQIKHRTDEEGHNEPGEVQKVLTE
jgi:hypothetical protein